MGTRLIPREADTQALILDWLTAERIKAIRYNTGKQILRYTNKAGHENRRMFQAHSAGNGHPDICAYPRLYRLSTDIYTDAWIPVPAVWWIEVKKIGEKQTDEQSNFQTEYESIGHYYTLAYSLDDCIRWLEAHPLLRRIEAHR